MPAEELTKGLEEAPMGLPFPPPPIEEIIHSFIMSIVKTNTPQGLVTTLQFITPVKVYTLRLDEEGATGLSDNIRPSGLVIAKPGAF